MSHHIVRRGETLSVIAHRYRSTVCVIARLNGIDDVNRVAIGLRLVVPGHRDPAPTTAPLAPTTPQNRSGARTRQETPAPRTITPPATDGVTAEQLRAIMPNAGNRVDTYLAPLNAAMRERGITTMESRAAFLAQIAVESQGLERTVENLNYSEPGLTATFGTSRISAADRRRLGRQPGERPISADRRQEIANIVYGGDYGRANLGNTDVGDGFLYRGRGLLMTTGRANYRGAGYEDRPESLTEPGPAADSAAYFWTSNGLDARTRRVLNRRQFNGITRTVNGGGHGSDERWEAYQRALSALRPADGR